MKRKSLESFNSLALILVVALLSGCVQLSPAYLKGSVYEKARVLYQDGKLFDARNMAEGVAPDDPAYKSARKLIDDIDFMMLQIAKMHMELGEDYERAGIYDMAMREYRTSLKYYPGNLILREKLKKPLEETKTDTGKIDEIKGEDIKFGEKKADKKKKKKTASLKKPGKKVEKKKKKRKKEDPRDLAHVHYLKGWVFLESKLYRRAIAEFEIVQKLVPSYMNSDKLLKRAKRERDEAIDLHLKRGISYFKKEELELAIEEWDWVLDLDPKNPVAADYKKRTEVIMESLKKIREGKGN